STSRSLSPGSEPVVYPPESSVIIAGIEAAAAALSEHFPSDANGSPTASSAHAARSRISSGVMLRKIPQGITPTYPEIDTSQNGLRLERLPHVAQIKKIGVLALRLDCSARRFGLSRRAGGVRPSHHGTVRTGLGECWTTRSATPPR